MRKIPLLRFQFFLILLSLHVQSLAQTTLEKANGTWLLKVDGEPYDIKGVTFGYDKEVDHYAQYFQDLNFLGVNTIRLWATDTNTKKLLDAADQYGIKVMVGIWMRHGRPGMEDDDSFNYLEDEKGMETMFSNAIKTVEAFKNHPAVLSWGVGNEVYLNMATDEEKKAYSHFLERVCSNIKTIDSNHPITSEEAWTFGLEWWEKYVPSLDIYGLNSYGPGVDLLASEMNKRAIDKPYIVTEFGVTGEWDMEKNGHGVANEPTDQQKYDAIAKGYHNWIKNKPACLGAFVFHYGNGDDFLAAWLFSHFKEMYRPQYWAIREAFTGNTPVNSVPVINQFELSQSQGDSGQWVPVTLSTSDSEDETLEVAFYYNQRTGSRKRRNQILPINFRGNLSTGFEIQLPQEDGGLKIYASVKDAYSNVGIASTSIGVRDEMAKNRKYLVPKPTLPFYVYQDDHDMPYQPSAYMGNYGAIEVDTSFKGEPYTGETSIKIRYTARDNWYGVGFVDPANDWGTILGGYDLSGAKTLSFWAKTSESKLAVKAGFGLIGSDKPYPDTAKKTEGLVLTPKWKKYTIKTKKLDLSCIRSGFIIFSNGNGFPHDIYLDDIVFE